MTYLNETNPTHTRQGSDSSHRIVYYRRHTSKEYNDFRPSEVASRCRIVQERIFSVHYREQTVSKYRFFPSLYRRDVVVVNVDVNHLGFRGITLCHIVSMSNGHPNVAHVKRVSGRRFFIPKEFS